MIKLLFGRFSLAVKIAEAAGALMALVALIRSIAAGAGAWRIALTAAAIALYAFIRFCATARWYRDVPRYSGIELQFKKALVPTGYTMSICFALYLLSGWTLWLVICDAFLVVVAHVNVILLYFHYRDRDPTQVNLYTSGRFLNR